MKIYQVDAFTNEKFKGNPAAVCVLPAEETADELWMQSVALEMNLSETAFVYKTAKKEGGWIFIKMVYTDYGGRFVWSCNLSNFAYPLGRRLFG